MQIDAVLTAEPHSCFTVWDMGGSGVNLITALLVSSKTHIYLSHIRYTGSTVCIHIFLCQCRHTCMLTRTCTSIWCMTTHYRLATYSTHVGQYLTRFDIGVDFLLNSGWVLVTVSVQPTPFPPKCPAVATVDSCFRGRTNPSCRVMKRGLLDFGGFVFP